MTTHYSLRIPKNIFRVFLGLALTGTASFGGYKYAQSAPITTSKFFVYQGRLTQPDGSPVASNVYNLQFGVYTDASATTKICDSTHENVVVKQGVFRVAIGQGATGLTGTCGSTDMQAEISSRPEMWLKISVKGPSDSAFQVLSPLVQIGATPRALYAASAGRAQVASDAEGALKAMIETLVPPGTVVAFAGPVAPAGWMLCDGVAYNRVTYSSLFAAIGSANGGGDGGTTFNVPDYRGRFLRGVDGAANRDPDSSSRPVPANGGNAGNLVGSVQSHTFTSHAHGATDSGHLHGLPGGYSMMHASIQPQVQYALQTGQGLGAYDMVIPTTSPGQAVITVANSGGSETRPANAYVNYIIKY